MRALKAHGNRGSWFARIGDEDVPCAFQYWLTKTRYLDPYIKTEEGKRHRYIEAIRKGKRVALTGKREDAEGRWQRDGYIALFEVDNVTVTTRGLEFDLVRRVANLR